MRSFDCVSAVYLAPNIASSYKEHICEIIMQKNKLREIAASNKKPISVYQTQISESEYSLKSIKVI